MSDTNWAALAAAAAAGSAATLGVAALLRNSKHAGKALRSTTASGSLGSAVYESERAAAEYLLFHFGTPSEVMPYTFGPHSALDFAHRCAKVCNKLAPPAGASQAGPTRALDVGCAVGRSSFDMAGAFDEVVGVDFSQSFIDVANELKVRTSPKRMPQTMVSPSPVPRRARAPQANGSRSYTAQVEGDIFKTLTARVDPAIPRGNVSFQQVRPHCWCSTRPRTPMPAPDAERGHLSQLAFSLPRATPARCRSPSGSLTSSSPPTSSAACRNRVPSCTASRAC